jgi:hypothetical protein
MSEEEVPVKLTAPKKIKQRKPFKSGQLFPSELDLREMKKYTRELLKQLGLKTGTRSHKV